MKQTRSLSEFTQCPKLPDFTKHYITKHVLSKNANNGIQNIQWINNNLTTAQNWTAAEATWVVPNLHSRFCFCHNTIKLSSCGGILTYAMFHHRKAINQIKCDETEKTGSQYIQFMLLKTRLIFSIILVLLNLDISNLKSIWPENNMLYESLKLNWSSISIIKYVLIC